MADDFSLLDDTLHMLQWLSDAPYAQIRREIEGWLNGQLAGSEVLWIRVTAEPQWLTGGRPSDKDESKLILVRTGVAIAFSLEVKDPSGAVHPLSGVFSWTGWGLDGEQRMNRMWFDVQGTLDELGKDGKLKERIYGEDLD